MKNRVLNNHLLRPLLVVIGVIIIVLVVRQLYVPGDFGIHVPGYTYGWYREGNIEDWKQVTVKYQGREYCANCHTTEVDLISTSPHAIIQCENCHGPGVGHPPDPPKLVIDKSRELCLRCHSELQYPSNPRSAIKGIDPVAHNPNVECVTCHNPHKPTIPGA